MLGQSTTQEYTINAVSLAISSANQSWMIHMHKELRIVLKSGLECRWRGCNTQARAELHTKVIFVKDVNTVIVEARAVRRCPRTMYSIRLMELEMECL